MQKRAMQVHLHCPLSPIYTLSNHHVSSLGSCLSKTPCESASHDISRNFHFIVSPLESQRVEGDPLRTRLGTDYFCQRPVPSDSRPLRSPLRSTPPLTKESTHTLGQCSHDPVASSLSMALRAKPSTQEPYGGPLKTKPGH